MKTWKNDAEGIKRQTKTALRPKLKQLPLAWIRSQTSQRCEWPEQKNAIMRV
jgi:hypothetical protein